LHNSRRFRYGVFSAAPHPSGGRVYGKDGNLSFGVLGPYDRKSASVGNGSMFAFRFDTRDFRDLDQQALCLLHGQVNRHCRRLTYSLGSGTLLPAKSYLGHARLSVSRMLRGRCAFNSGDHFMFAGKSSALIVAAVLGTAVVAGCAATEDRASTGQTIDDSVITTKIKAKLIEDPVTKAHEISVETFKGTVQLSGFVETAAESAQAARIANSVDGVKNVKNSLVLRKSTS
jgi:hypothetical protein